MSLLLTCTAAAALALAQGPPDAQDPEALPAGRARFLGREVAQTMHWTGAGWLMRATREDEENGALLRRWLAVRAGQTVCDLGCGNGYHTLPLAESVGDTGRVYAVDLQPQMLTLLKRRSEAAALDNIAFVEATVDDPRLPPRSCNLVLMVDVYHELSHPVRVMAHVRRALRPGGRVVLVEFRAEDPDVPIKPEHMMSKAQVVRELAAHGFAFASECDDLPWQHAMTFVAADDPGPRFAARQFVRAFLRAAAGDDARVVAPFLGGGLDADRLPALRTDLRVELRAGAGDRLVAQLREADGGRLPHGQDELTLQRDDVGRWHVTAIGAPRRDAARPFVAMHTGLGRGDVATRVALATELGFDGVAWDLTDLRAARRACEAGGGDLLSAYATLDVGAPDVAARVSALRPVIGALRGGPGMLWLALKNGALPPRDAQGDAAAVAALAPLLDAARDAGVELALYPHHGHWLETTEHALRLCERADREHLGVCFNLCHYLRANDDHDPTALLARCGDRLFAVTVNGADRDGRDWRALIRPLGEGDFDVHALLDALDAAGFAGPIGLQGYGIGRAPRDHLSASMAAWRTAQASRR